MEKYELNCAIFISFDAVALSGITVEACKIARELAKKGLHACLDLGYDIKLDKGNFNKPYSYERDIYRDVFTLLRIDDISSVPFYYPEFIERAHGILISQKIAATAQEKKAVLAAVNQSAAALAEKIMALWRSLHVCTVIVENGTLPENIIYTRALRLAIEQYGRENQLGRYVIWRDHDLMWNSEKTAMKYGAAPWPHAVKPVKSPYIAYVTLNEDLKRKLEAWCDGEVEISVKKNTYDFAEQRASADIRAYLGIRPQDILIARTTRIIPQKRIDRDIVLTRRLNQLFGRDDIDRKVWLVIAGDTDEHAAHYAELEALIARQGVASCVRFIGPLHHNCISLASGAMTIEDLYHACDLVSFLTSWDYDSYGNPIGEAISSRRCYITTRYEYYQEVYGQHGFTAPVMEISEEKDGWPDDTFIHEVYALLNDRAEREKIAESNFLIGKQVLANNVIDIMDFNRSGGNMRDTTFVSVVLPVFNESDRIDAVLLSLLQQQTRNGLITHASYELIIVDNNSTDDSVGKINDFHAQHPAMDIHIIEEKVQGVSSARKRGMDYASLRSRARDSRLGREGKHYIVSADADCTVDPWWLHELVEKMMTEKGDLGTCNYYYNLDSFRHRPNLFREIDKTLRCRDFSFSLFGGFPDGKGFAVERTLYDRVGGIEILYQLNQGRFVEHLSDDWDFGIRVIAWGGKPVYASASRVEINSRRVDTILEEVITGVAYGRDGIITMKDVRPDSEAQRPALADTNEMQSQQAWFYSIKDYIPKNIILPALLNPQILLERDDVRAFYSGPVADQLYARIHEIKNEMRLIDFKPIHAYKTPAYRLYFEFRDALFAALRRAVGEDIGYPPPLPACLEPVRDEDFNRFVWYFCEDRESGEAHNYFANGGVF